MAVLFAGVGFGLYRVVENHLYQSVDAALISSAKSIHDARFVRGFSTPLMEEFLSKVFGERYIRPYAQLVDLSGKISAKTTNIRISLPVTPQAIRRAEKGLDTFETFYTKDNKVPFRQVTLPVFINDRFTGELIQVGAPLDYTIYTLNGIKLVLWIALPTGMLLSVLFGYLLARRAFRPVTDITQAASKLGIDDLGVRLKLPPAKDELRRLAQTFNETLDRLEDAFRRLRCFSGDVSHELRTPIAVMRGEAELALRRDRTPAEYKAALQAIVTESASMSGLVEDLLLLARAESRAVAANHMPVGLEEFVNSLEASVAPVFEKRGVGLDIDLAGTNSLASTIIASRQYLAIALKNILLNAAKHSASDSRVTFGVTLDDKGIVFRIEDQGEGIPEKDLPYIFDPFYRADTVRNRSAGGAGIGLSLALAMVKLHSGTISVESKVGTGTAFTIRIPRLEPSPVVPRAKESNPEVCASVSSGIAEKKRISGELPAPSQV